MKRFLTTASLIAVVGLATSANAAIIGFEAESGTLGSDFDPALNDAGASSGSYITAETSGGGTAPGSDPRTATYSVAFATAGTYNLYAKLYIDGTTGNPVGAADDSMYYAADFGPADSTSGTDWILVNGLANVFTAQTYFWVNLSVETGNFGETGTTFSVAAPGSLDFEIGSREDGLRIDAFVFSTDSELSDAALDAAVVPEPGSLALLGLGGLLIARRRRA